MILEGITFLVVAFLVLFFGWEWYWIAGYLIRSWQAGYTWPQFGLSWPLGIPFIVNNLKANEEHQFLEKSAAAADNFKTGTYVRQSFMNFAISTTDPENIKALLSTHFKDFSLGARKEQFSAFGNGIFTLSGEGWKHSRAMLRPQFTRDQVSQLTEVDAHINTMVDVIESAQKVDKYVDIQKYLPLLTIDTATEFLFGESLNSLLDPEMQTRIVVNGESIATAEFMKSFTFVQQYTLKRAMSNGLYFLLNSKEFQFHTSRIRLFVEYYVQKALKATASTEKSEKSENDSYTFMYELAKVTRDPVVIRDQSLNILLAGRDTTASALAFAFYYLAKNPTVYQKLRQEIIATFGDNESSLPVTFEKLRNAQYLNWFTKEVLRLSPVVPINFRSAIRDTFLPRGAGPEGNKPVFVPKGTEVNYSVYRLHRLPSVWGPDANEFRPERWSEALDMHPWAYLPFNGGPRICLGQQFALTEMNLVLVRMLQKYSKLEPAPHLGPVPQNEMALILRVANGVPVRFS